MTGCLAELSAAVRARRQELDRQAGRAQQVVTAGRAAEAEAARLGAAVELHAKVAALLAKVGEEAQESARAMFEELATRALQVIFGDGLSFCLVPGETGGQVTLEPAIRSEHEGGLVLETPVMDARGGGMAAVVGFVLRLVMVLLTPSARKVLFLDESFRFVSESYIDRVAEFLREVTDRTGVQVVMITHDRAFTSYADAAYRFTLGPDGATQVFEGESE